MPSFNQEERLVLDTHIFLWLMSGDPLLATPARETLIDVSSHGSLCVSAISLWEIAMLEKKERIALRQPCLSWIQKALSAPSIVLVPLSPEISVESCNLPGDFHGDPADRMIVATARYLSAPVMTRDQKIIAYAKEGHLSWVEG